MMKKKSKKNVKETKQSEVLEETKVEDTPKTEKEATEDMAALETKQKEIDNLKARIKELEDELEAAKNDYLKAYADTENTKRRLRQDFEMHNKYRLQNFALDILPAIDNLERALANTSKDDPVYQGVQMIYNQLIESLKKEGVEEIKADGETFDPNFHHAISMESVEGVEAGKVVEVLQKGYKIKDRVLRATLVKVSE